MGLLCQEIELEKKCSHHDTAEILLKFALNINHSINRHDNISSTRSYKRIVLRYQKGTSYLITQERTTSLDQMSYRTL
jgi:hypothetical protein